MVILNTDKGVRIYPCDKELTKAHEIVDNKLFQKNNRVSLRDVNDLKNGGNIFTEPPLKKRRCQSISKKNKNSTDEFLKYQESYRSSIRLVNRLNDGDEKRENEFFFDSTYSYEIKTLDVIPDSIKLDSYFKKNISNQDSDVESKAKLVSGHQVINHGPILQSPVFPYKSIFEKAEDDTSLLHIKWYLLKQELYELPLQLRHIAEEKIMEEMQEWIFLNKNEPGNFQKKLESILEVRTPTDGPERGKSLYAKEDLRKFQVLGPYAGILCTTQKELNDLVIKYGEINISTFLFGTSNQQRAISGYQHGNLLTYINTGKLRDHPRIAKDNVKAVRLGKNLMFFIAAENIKKGQELFISYGDKY